MSCVGALAREEGSGSVQPRGVVQGLAGAVGVPEEYAAEARPEISGGQAQRADERIGAAEVFMADRRHAPERLVPHLRLEIEVRYAHPAGPVIHVQLRRGGKAVAV